MSVVAGWLLVKSEMGPGGRVSVVGREEEDGRRKFGQGMAMRVVSSRSRRRWVSRGGSGWSRKGKRR
jgi:hypothetical protein